MPDWYRVYCVQYPFRALLSGGVLVYCAYSRFWAKKTQSRTRLWIELVIILVSGVLLYWYLFGWIAACIGDI